MSQISELPLAYHHAGTNFRGTVLKPLDTAIRAAVVLLPDWRGQSLLAREHATHLVKAGCLVAIADLYGGGLSPTDPNQVGPMVKHLLDNRHEGVASLEACFKAFAQHHAQEVPVYCLGYSAGGMIALDYGRSGADLAGIILCSALLKTAEAGKPAGIVAPVLILQGTQDVVSPMSVISAVVAEMDEAGNDLRLELYGQTHHAFDNPEAGTDPTARLCYSPTAATRARQAILKFIGVAQ